MKLLWGVLPWLVLVPAWGQDNRTDGTSPAPNQAQQGQQAQSADRTKDNSNGNTASQTPVKKQDRLFFAAQPVHRGECQPGAAPEGRR